MEIVIGLDAKNNVYVASFMRGVRVSVDADIVKKAIRTAAAAYYRHHGHPEYVGEEDYGDGFMQTIKRGIESSGIATNPLIAMLATHVPAHEGPVPMLDLAGMAVQFGTQALASLPAPAVTLAHGAATDEDARSVLAVLMAGAQGGDPHASAAVSDVARAAMLLRDVFDAQQYLGRNVIDTVGVDTTAIASTIGESAAKGYAEGGAKGAGATAFKAAAGLGGAAAGAAIGAAIGSAIPIPGIGTAVGALIGVAMPALAAAITEWMGAQRHVDNFGQWLAYSRPSLHGDLQTKFGANAALVLQSIDSDPFWFIPEPQRGIMRSYLERVVGRPLSTEGARAAIAAMKAAA